ATSDWFASDPIVIRNTVPRHDAVRLEPASGATEATVFECIPEGFLDPDDDPEGYRFAWHLGGVAIPGATAAILTGEHFARGDVVSCSARPWDGFESGQELFSEGVTVGNSLPTVGNLRL